MLIVLLIRSFLMAATQIPSDAPRNKIFTLSNIVTYNTPSFVEGLMASTKTVALIVKTKFRQFTGLPLIHEAFVHFEPKKNVLKSIISNEGVVALFRGGVSLKPSGYGGCSSVYNVMEGDVVFMLSTWDAALEFDEQDVFDSVIGKVSTLDMGEFFLSRVPATSGLNFILAQVVDVRETRVTFTRLQRQRQASSDSFEGPMSLNPASISERKETLVLQWSSSDDFDESFFGPADEATSSTQSIDDMGSENTFRTTHGRGNCDIQ